MIHVTDWGEFRPPFTITFFHSTLYTKALNCSLPIPLLPHLDPRPSTCCTLICTWATHHRVYGVRLKLSYEWKSLVRRVRRRISVWRGNEICNFTRRPLSIMFLSPLSRNHSLVNNWKRESRSVILKVYIKNACCS